MLSVIVPTKNRRDDLTSLVQSIEQQTVRPDQLVVVDQSDVGCEDDIFAILSKTEVDIIYVHDPKISSLVEAKHVGVSKCNEPLICFLDDDIILDKDYFEVVIGSFKANPAMVGCSGVIKNQAGSSSNFTDFVYGLFFRGILRDPRRRIFKESGGGMVKCNMICGGVSAWRSSVFKDVEFDLKNGFFFLEDIEFSTRVEKYFGSHLYINKDAKVYDRRSQVNRHVPAQAQRRKIREALMYYKKRRETSGALYSIILALSWWMIAASHQSLKFRSFAPLAGFCSGLLSGIQSEVKR